MIVFELAEGCREDSAYLVGCPVGEDAPSGPIVGPLGVEEQMQMDPPHNPHNYAVLRRQSTELPHSLTHKPANPILPVLCSGEAAGIAALARSECEGEGCEVRRYCHWRLSYPPSKIISRD